LARLGCLFVSPLLADPEWCNKAYAGDVGKICPCIGCQEGCINEFVDGGHPQCAVNPRTGFEDILPENPPKADKPKKIGVVGAGPAGLQLAIVAAKRGHTVELVERGAAVGGKVVPGSVPKIKFDIENYLQFLAREVEAAKALPNFSILLRTEATNEWLKSQGYDAIVFAYGTKNGTPRLPGIERIKTVQATDLLADPALLGDAQKIVVVGGGVVGCETAYWLAYEHGRDVKVVEMLPHFMDGACTANRGHLIHYLSRKGVELINCAKVTSFEPGQVHINRNVSSGVPNPYNTWQPILPKNIENPLAKKLGAAARDETLEADLVVLAMGGQADETMYFEARKAHVAPEMYNIGDSFSSGRVLEATRAAYSLASRI